MKRNILIYMMTVAGAMITLASCSLKEDAQSMTTPEQFFKTEPQILAAVNGCYDPLNYFHNLQYYIATEGTTDLASTNGSAQRDAKLDINPASPGAGTIVWRQCYRGIRYCLSTEAGINRSELEESIKAPYRAETKILESYYWYVLTSFYGDVPFYQKYVETDEDMTEIAKLGRMPAYDTRETFIEILRNSASSLPQIRTSQIAGYRCGAAMGWMVMAKMAAWNEDWDVVIEACEHLEAIYGDLMQYDYADCMFRRKGTAESIFEIQHAFEEGGIEYITPSSLSIGTVVMPFPKKADGPIYDYNEVTIEELGSRARCYTPLRPTSYCKSVVCPTGTGDIRRDLNMASSWNGRSFSTTWMGPKFWCPNMYLNYDSNNYKIFRYADALLLMAEAYCEKGEYSESVKYLNKVRERAQISNYTFISAVKLRGEIRDERGRELFGEFGRRFDLVRWGIWYDQVKAYNLYSNVQSNIRPCHEYYPIPDAQCQVSGGILSNPEYLKYNLSE